MVKRRYALTVIAAAAAIIALAAGFYGFFAGRVWLSPSNILSRVSAKFEGGAEQTLVLRKAAKQDGGPPGEAYGDYIFVFDGLPVDPAGFYGYKAKIPLEGLKPLKLLAGDVNGDGVPELSVTVYKATPLDPGTAKRPFFYSYRAGALYPFWRGSRLSRPFADYALWDAGDGGAMKLVSDEYLSDGKMALALYEWDDFGFVRAARSGEYDGLALAPQEEPGEIRATDSDGRLLKFHYDGAETLEEVD